MFEKAPDGHFVRDMIILGDLGRGGTAVKGFALEPPDLEHAREEDLAALETALRVWLSGLNPRHGVQIQWTCDPDYRAELLAYAETTARGGGSAFCRRHRDRIFVRLWERMEARELRRERLCLFLCVPVPAETPAPGRKPGGGGAARYHLLLKQLEQEFESAAHALKAALGPAGVRIDPLNDATHAAFCHRFLNPSAPADAAPPDPADHPGLSMQELCWNGELAPGPEGHGFYMDGRHHAVLALKRLPSVTFPRVTRLLTGAGLDDFRITQNILRLDAGAEIRRLEREHRRVRGDIRAEGHVALRGALDLKAGRIASLARGDVFPFSLQTLLCVWDRSPEGLQEKLSALRAAVASMHSAQAFEPALFSTSTKLFWQTWPGHAFGRYRDFSLYVEDRNLAHLLPFSATPQGHLRDAEAIYEGSRGNLVGVRTFLAGTPQHALMTGMSGAGKSVNMCDLLTQTEPYYDYTVLIEEGLSYGVYTRAADPGAEPVVISPDGALTLNPFDTGGLPLSPHHLSAAAALCLTMAGGETGPEGDVRRRTALLSRFIRRLYEEGCAEWLRGQPPEREPELARLALLAEGRRRAAPGLSFAEALRETESLPPAAWEEALARVSEAEAAAFLKSPAGAACARSLAFARMGAEEQPQLGQLVELMEFSLGRDPEARELALTLREWCAGGPRGPLFDGVTSIRLTGRVTHFELGAIPESAPELRSAAAFLLTNHVRNHILSLPRGARKRLVFEEAARLLSFPGGEKLIREAYQQLRKHGCWAVSVVQQYGAFRDSPARSAVLGNSRLFFLMRQADRADAADLGDALGLPESARAAVLSHPLPDSLPEGRRHASFTCVHSAESGPLIFTARNEATPEMLCVASSGGPDFEARSRRLAAAPDILEAVIAEAATLRSEP